MGSGKIRSPAHRFADLSEPDFGLAILNNAKYGHSVRGDIMGLSLVRSPIYPDPLADEGLQSFTYSLMPHAGGWSEGGVREEAEDLNQPVESVVRRGASVPASMSAPTTSALPLSASAELAKKCTISRMATQAIIWNVFIPSG
jgi:alpha-mannosidase